MLKKNSVYILFVIMIILNGIFTPNFFHVGTLRNLISQTCTIILTGMGMTVVISTGGIDISCGAVMALSGIIGAKLINTMGIVPAILIALCVCALSGALAGFMVGVLRVQAMVVTLALMIGVRGVAEVINQGNIYYISGERADAYEAIGTARIGNAIPVQIIPIVIAIFLTWFIMNRTVLGFRVQAVGDNARAAKLTGINSARTLMFCYIYSAVCAGMAGIILSCKSGAADPNTLGLLAELDAIAAVAVGGADMSGGKAHVFGTVVGALIMQLITIMVNMNNITYEYAQVFKAIIIIVAVYIQTEKTS